MIRFSFICFTALLLCCSSGSLRADTVEENDALRIQLAQAKVQLAQRALDEARRNADTLVETLKTKYKLVDGDVVDIEKRTITRAPKPPTLVPPKK